MGGGIAAATAADTLRAASPDASIVIVGDEPDPPYRRPQLSKALFADASSLQRLPIGDADRYRAHGIELLLGTRARAVDPRARTVTTDRAGTIAYDELLIATGASAHALGVPGETLPGVCRLRTIADARALAACARPGRRALVVGAGFSGLEIAATLRQAGLAVTVTDHTRDVYPKLASPELSRFYADLLATHDVGLALGARVVAFEGSGRVRAARLDDGRRLPADVVVVAIGIAPNTGFLDGSGLAVDDGVRVDAMLRASVPHVWAAGDVACFDDVVLGGRRRIEHWDNAVGQGRLAARNMLGARRQYDELTHFYTDVFDAGFKFLGDPAGADRRLLRGSLESRSAALFYLGDGRLRAFYSLGRPGDEVQAAELLMRSQAPLADPAATLTDPARPLSRVLPRQRVLILQGGGALGAFEAGVVRAMEELGQHPDIVAGVSIGAINGAIVASHPKAAAPVLRAFWEQLAVDGLPGAAPAFNQALATWQVAALGLPGFFQPRWTMPSFAPAGWPGAWTSLYDTRPLAELLARFVDFEALKSSPVRLLVSAVNVETAELEVFDSHVDQLRAEHIIASGSLPPGFPWTTIGGAHYWDGGLISNSPLQQVVDRCGVRGKDVVVVDLFSSRRPLPSNLAEVMTRRDEILYAERIASDYRAHEQAQDYRLLVEEIVGLVDARTEALIRQRPRFIRLMGDAQPLRVQRIVREPLADERSSRDYDFSADAIRANADAGHRQARRTLGATAQAAGPGS